MTETFAYPVQQGEKRRLFGRAASWILIAVAAMSWTVVLRPSSLGGAVTYVLVRGHSMDPAIVDGSLAIVRADEDLRRGDIVAFRVDEHIVVHRIVGRTRHGAFVTQGDNATAQDPWHPTHDEVLGTVWLTMPSAAPTVLFLRDPVHLAGLAAALTVFLILMAPRERATTHRSRILPAGRAR
jgi:signal peptidase